MPACYTGREGRDVRHQWPRPLPAAAAGLAGGHHAGLGVTAGTEDDRHEIPRAAIERASYHAVFRGEMRWIGVAILSRTPRVPSRPEPPCPATQPTRSPGTSRRGPRRADRQPVPAPRQSPGRRRSSTIKSNECGTDYATPQADTGSPRSWPATIPCCQPTRYLHHAVLAQERPTEVQTACWPPIYQMA